MEQYGMAHDRNKRKQRSPWRLRRGIFIMCGSSLFFTMVMNQRLITPLHQIQQQRHSLSSDDSVSSWIVGDNSSITSVLTSVKTVINDSVDYVTTSLMAHHADNSKNIDQYENNKNTPRQHSNSSLASALLLSSQSTKNETNHMLRIHNGKERVGADRLPQWFHDYSIWHTQSLQDLARHGNYHDYQYVLLRCVRKDGKCSGTSDRLKMIPVMLKLAYVSQRLFFIYWSRPCPLEEFLLPNTNYINWTVPYDLYEPLNVEATYPLWGLGSHLEQGMLDAESQSQQVLRIVTMLYASHYYDTHPIPHRIDDTTSSTSSDSEGELPMWDVYADFWRALFVPSEGVRNKILATLRDLDLLLSDSGNNNDDDDDPFIQIGQNTTMASLTASNSAAMLMIPNITVRPYVSVHVRANYTLDESDRHLEVNAIRCAAMLQQQYLTNVAKYDNRTNISLNTSVLPIYVASDTLIVAQRAIQYGRDHGVRVVSRDSHVRRFSNDTNNGTYNMTNNNNPYHIDQPPPMTHPSDFYDTFVDLYLLAMGRCHSWGVGGYGSWAYVIAPKAKPDVCTGISHYQQQCSDQYLPS
jgi:hypothetical protein